MYSDTDNETLTSSKLENPLNPLKSDENNTIKDTSTNESKEQKILNFSKNDDVDDNMLITKQTDSNETDKISYNTNSKNDERNIVHPVDVPISDHPSDNIGNIKTSKSSSNSSLKVIFENSNSILKNSNSSSNTSSRKHSLKHRTSSISSQPICPIELQKTLDPQIQEELENLNETSNKINEIENLLETCRSEHRAVLSNSAQVLGICSNRLGVCVEKARPFYIAKYKAKIAQKAAQDATIKYERAVSNHEAAKELVNIAEQNMRVNKTDPAWHQMLNHSTNRVNEAEIERFLIDELVNQTTKRAITTQIDMVKLNKEHKTAILNSREYFELKNILSEKLYVLQGTVEDTSNKLKDAKMNYKSALKRLENISERIHFAREQQKKRENSMSENVPYSYFSDKSYQSEDHAFSCNRKNSSVSAVSDSFNSEISNTSSVNCALTPYHNLQEKNLGTNQNPPNPQIQDSLIPQNSQTSSKSTKKYEKKVLSKTVSMQLPTTLKINQTIATKSNSYNNTLEESQSVVEIALAKHKQAQLTYKNNIFNKNPKLPCHQHYRNTSLSACSSHEEIIHADLLRRDSLEKVDTNRHLTHATSSDSINTFLKKEQNLENSLNAMSFEQKNGTYNNSNSLKNSIENATSSGFLTPNSSSGFSSRTNSSGRSNKSSSSYKRMASMVFQSLSVKDLGK